ncbi:MAG: GPW/gp25 family protein [Caldilineaceae bacterium]|nr:GPW/gp25 family protein [Caldilineaceae bacterium]
MEHEITGCGWGFPLSISVTGGISLTDDRSEIDQSLHLILSTMPGERVMRPAFGTSLHEIAFEPANSQTAARAKRIVEEAVTMWEPRIDLLDVDVTWHNKQVSMLLIQIHYRIKNRQDRRSLVYPFYIIPHE